MRRPAKRLLIAPGLLFAAVVATVILTASAAGSPPDVRLDASALVPPITQDATECRRDREDTPATDEPLGMDGGRVTSGQVFACPEAFDGRRVTYAGEAVGDVLRRDGGAWVLVNDDDYALVLGPLPSHRDHRGTNSGLSVWVPDELLDRISGLGRPNQRGDVLLIDGHIVRTDTSDGGGLTLRADDLEVLRPAVALNDPLHLPQVLLAAISLLSAAVLAALRRRGRN